MLSGPSNIVEVITIIMLPATVVLVKTAAFLPNHKNTLKNGYCGGLRQNGFSQKAEIGRFFKRKAKS